MPMNFNHAAMVTQSLIIQKKNQPDLRFKVVLPCSVMYLDRSHIQKISSACVASIKSDTFHETISCHVINHNKSKIQYNQFVLQICHHKYNSDRVAALLTAIS